MALTLTLSIALAIAGILLAGGFVVGLTGFGFAIVGTASLAVLLDPQTAVVLMLIPILSANLSLVTELDVESLRSCTSRFWPYVGAALLGTLLGMALLSRIPTQPLTLVLGVLLLGYVGLTQEYMTVPGKQWLEDRCFGESTPAKVGLGFVSGAVFGASNVGVQVVAYLRSRGLDRDVFIGVMAMIFLGISALRIGAAWWLGLYGRQRLVVISALAAVPGLIGVGVGKFARSYAPERYQRAGVFALLTVIGAKLTASGLGLGI